MKLEFKDLVESFYLFRKGKRHKLDIIEFESNFEENIYDLYVDLESGRYKHEDYTKFITYDPKRREIAKACVRDRIVHDLVYRRLVEIYDRSFYYHSYASRQGKGTHIAVKTLHVELNQFSLAGRREVWILKLDIQKFFANMDHGILKRLIRRKVDDGFLLKLCDDILDSFHTEGFAGKGIPLGNSTSQIFANIYLHELDRFVIHEIRPGFYTRYMDDLVLLSTDKLLLESALKRISEFIKTHLFLVLHPRKISFRKYYWGVDFLGHVLFQYGVILRPSTERRIQRRLGEKTTEYPGDRFIFYNSTGTLS